MKSDVGTPLAYSGSLNIFYNRKQFVNMYILYRKYKVVGN